MSATINGSEDDNGPDAAQLEIARKNQMALAQYAEMSGPAPIYATMLTACVQVNDMVRVCYGDQIHLAAKPRFYASFVAPVEALRGFKQVIDTIISQYDEMKEAQEVQNKLSMQ